MTTPVAVGLRETARALPLRERHRRLATVRRAPAAVQLQRLLEAALGAGEWKSSSDVAEEVFVVNPRTFRRWLAGEQDIPEAARRKIFKLAWAFGVEVVDRL